MVLLANRPTPRFAAMETTLETRDGGSDPRTARDRSAIVVTRHGPQVRITISRVEKHNALSREVLSALAAAVNDAAGDETCSHVVVTGAGDRYFAAGGDLVDLAVIRSEADTRDFAVEARSALDTLRRSAVPVIGWLNGNAIGGGAELAMACDLRVAASTARIGYIQSRLAITSAWGGGPDLVARVGASRAMRMMMRAEQATAAEAWRDGLVDAVIDGGPDGDDGRAFLRPFDDTPRHVLAAIKANVAASRGDADAARATETNSLVATWTHPAHWAAVDRVFASTRKRPD